MNEIFTTIPIFASLTNEQIESINNNLNIVSYKKGDIIFKQNTPCSHIMFIKSGLVKVFKECRNNRFIITEIIKANNFIGFYLVFGENFFQFSGSAIEPTEIYFIDLNVFKNIILQNGEFASYIIKIISANTIQITNKLINITQKQLPGRIAEIILFFSKEIYNSDKFEFPLTRQELAELAATTKESFIRTLSEFKNDKIIDLDGRTVEIKSMEIINILTKLG
jgi:CRP-like cAMP-binding protein